MNELRVPLTPQGRLAEAGGLGVERYRLGPEIARGGMGVVCRAHDEVLGRDLAVKLLLANPGERPDLVRRFEQEARITGRLQHPGVPPVYELGWLVDGRPFLALRLIEGRTLADLLREEGGAGRDHLLLVFEQVCQTVAYAHSQRIIHRDLKPQNVMVGPFGEVQVVDWGLARCLDDGSDDLAQLPADWDCSPPLVTATGSVLGTPAYMAPERARGDRGDLRADVFGLGAILCELLTGRPPYEPGDHGPLTRLLAGNSLDVIEGLRQSDADPMLVELACRCLSPDPQDRPGCAGELARAIDDHLATVRRRLRQAELERAAAEGRALAERNRRRLTGTLAAMLVMLVVLAAGLWLKGAMGEQRGRQDAARQAEAGRLVTQAALNQAQDLIRLRQWGRAAGVLERTLAQLDAGPPPPGVDRLRSLLADLRLARDLENVRLHTRLFLDAHAAVRAGPQPYEQVFLRHRVNLREDDLAQLASWLADSAVADEVYNGLYAWLLEEGPGDVRDRLDRLLTLADPCRWRARLRRGQELEQLAADLPVAPQPSAMVTLLARLLDQARLDSLPLRRKAQARFPDEFWYNHELAIALAGSPLRYREGIAFSQVAVALRSDLAVAWNTLGVLQTRARHPEAIRTMFRAVELAPDLAPLRVNLAVSLLQAGRLTEADEQTELALTRSPALAEAHLVRGTLRLARGDPPGARKAINEALRLAPGMPAAREKLALAYLQEGDARQAAWVIERSGTEALGRATMQHVRAMVLQQSGSPVEALKAITRALELHPDEPNFLLTEATILEKQGKRAEALDRCCAALLIEPEQLDACQRLAVFKDLRKAPARFEALTQAVVQRHPHRAASHAVQALSLLDRRETHHAEQACRRALALDHRLGTAHFLRGVAREMRGDLEAAAEAFYLAAGYSPHDARPLMSHAALQLRRAQATAKRAGPAEAEPLYRLALDTYRFVGRQGNDPPAALVGEAQVHIARKDTKRAMSLIQNALTRFTNEPRLLNTRGTLEKMTGNVTAAQKTFEEAITAAPWDAAARLNLAQLLIDMGQREDGVKVLRRACDDLRYDPLVHLRLGQVVAKAGTVRAAREAEPVLRKALELDDGVTETRMALAGVLMRLAGEQEVVDLLTPVAALESENVFVVAMLGSAQFRTCRYRAAHQSLSKALVLLPPGEHPWRRPLNEQLKSALRGIAAEVKVEELIAKKQVPARDDEHLIDMAEVYAKAYRQPAAAAGWLVDRFGAEVPPTALSHPLEGWRLRAALIALDAARVAPTEQVRWRRQALTWLEEDRREWARTITSLTLPPAERRRALVTWLTRVELSPVRDEPYLGKLPPEERRAWADFWTRVREDAR